MSPARKAPRWLPHPWLSIALLIAWVLLTSFTPGSLVLGGVLALVVPAISRMFWPESLDIARYRSAPRLFVVFLYDLVMANVVVAWRIIAFWRELRPTWVVIPLDLRNPTAIAVLANMISLTPGTVSSQLTADRLELLVHVLHTDDPQAEVETIKRRYEQPLQEIFQ